MLKPGLFMKNSFHAGVAPVAARTKLGEHPDLIGVRALRYIPG